MYIHPGRSCCHDVTRIDDVTLMDTVHIPSSSDKRTYLKKTKITYINFHMMYRKLKCD